METENVYELDDSKIRTLDNFIIIRKSHISKEKFKKISIPTPPNILKSGDIKIYFF